MFVADKRKATFQMTGPDVNLLYSVRQRLFLNLELFNLKKQKQNPPPQKSQLFAEKK